MTLTPFKGRCHTCGHDHDAESQYVVDMLGIEPPAPAQAAEPTRSQKLAAAGFRRRPSLWAMQAREVLELIAAPMRPDGTWNRDRLACQRLAAEALGRYDDEPEQAAEHQPCAMLDGQTPHEFVLSALHSFQEATGCDTADQLKPTQPQEAGEDARDGWHKALEFAEYMAKGAEALLDAVNARDAGYSKIEEIEGDRVSTHEEREEYQELIATQNEHATGLRADIYEFRKRAARALGDGGA